MATSFRSGGLVWPEAEVADRAAGAVWPLRLAGGPTVEDEQVGDEGPFLFGNNPAEQLLDLILFVTLCQAQPIGYPCDMGVHRDPLGDAKRVAQNDVGCLAPHAGQMD